MTGKTDIMRWGVKFRSEKDAFLVGVAWLYSGRIITPPIIPWPAAYPSRRQARAAAKDLENKYFHLRPHHVWTFKAVRIHIRVEEIDRMRNQDRPKRGKR